MTSFERIEEIKQNHEALKLQFVMTELEMAITFCQVARSTENESTARRNINNAKRAYEAAEKALQGIPLNEAESLEIGEQMQKAKSMIEDLK